MDGIPFWQSFLICVSGGVLGVLFTIPLRRALVTTSDLPYPEGVAAAEVLKVGSGTRGETRDETGEAREGLVAVILGSVASAGLAILTATRIAAADVADFFRLGSMASIRSFRPPVGFLRGLAVVVGGMFLGMSTRVIDLAGTGASGDGASDLVFAAAGILRLWVGFRRARPRVLARPDAGSP